MRAVFVRSLSGVVFALSCSVAFSAEQEDSAVDPSDWNLRNGCVLSHNIKRVTFDSGNSGVVELRGGKKLIITLQNRCPGIRTQGYVHKPINNRFCEGDILRVINYGNSCVVDKLEPLIMLEPNNEENPADSP